MSALCVRDIPRGGWYRAASGNGGLPWLGIGWTSRHVALCGLGAHRVGETGAVRNPARPRANGSKCHQPRHQPRHQPENNLWNLWTDKKHFTRPKHDDAERVNPTVSKSCGVSHGKEKDLAGNMLSL